MSRKLTVNGKRELLAVRVSEPVFAAVRQAAGGREQTPQWVRDVVCAALAAEGLLPDEGPVPSEPASHPAPEKRKRPPKATQARARASKPPSASPAAKSAPPARTRPSRAPGTAVFQYGDEAEAIITDAPPAPAATRTKCNHRIFRMFGSRDPGARGVDGCCPECGHAVEPGGYWEPECDAGTCGHPGREPAS